MTDQDIGIPREDQLHLLESFHRASNIDARQGAVLTPMIVKKVVALHGGTIAIDSKLDAGTRIRVRPPLTQAAWTA